MPTATYDLIASTVLSSSASSVSFASISGSYRDLVFRIVAGTSSAGQIIYEFNADTTALNYPSCFFEGDGGSGGSTTNRNNRLDASTTNNDLTVLFELFDYAQTNKEKHSIIRGDNANSKTYVLAGRWANTSAITEVVFKPQTGTFNSGSTFYLYGIVG